MISVSICTNSNYLYHGYSYVEHVFYDNAVSGQELDSDWPRPLSALIEVGRDVSDSRFEEAQAKVQPGDDMIYFTTSVSCHVGVGVVLPWYPNRCEGFMLCRAVLGFLR